MMFANHQAFGLGAGLALYKYLDHSIPATELFIAIPLIMLGILLPDIDTPDSKLGSKVPFISYPIGSIFGHRSITHSMLFCGGMMYYGVSIDSPILFWLGFGAYMHILGDFFTPSGVPLMWPITKRFRFFITFATGGMVEYVFAWSVFFAGIGYLLNFQLAYMS